MIAVLTCLAPPEAAQDRTITIDTVATTQQCGAIASRLQEILGVLGGYDAATIAVQEGVVTFDGTVTDASDTARLDDLANRVAGVVTTRNNVAETSDVGAGLNPVLDRFQTRIAQTIAFRPLLTVAAVVFAVIVWGGLWVTWYPQPWNTAGPQSLYCRNLSTDCALGLCRARPCHRAGYPERDRAAGHDPCCCRHRRPSAWLCG